MKSKNCRICGTLYTSGLVFKEMMFGMRNEFPYGECSNCGCIQIVEVPQNIDKYYPPYYVSFTQKIPALKRLPFIKRLVKNARIKRKYRRQLNDPLLAYLKPTNILPGAKILDIGCGKGDLMCKLFNLGFENITGIDKFISQPIDYGFGVEVLKKDLSELKSNTYDLLVMHHVLEHVDEQVKELKECYRLLKKGGMLLVSIPVLGAAWDIYKENWVQIDAPRHFVLHTLKSINMLAEKTGFEISETIFDSSDFQFWGSELYKKNIPLTVPDTHEWYDPQQTFSAEEMLHFKKEAVMLNASQKGDAARFYLHKI